MGLPAAKSPLSPPAQKCPPLLLGTSPGNCVVRSSGQSLHPPRPAIFRKARSRSAKICPESRPRVLGPRPMTRFQTHESPSSWSQPGFLYRLPGPAKRWLGKRQKNGSHHRAGWPQRSDLPASESASPRGEWRHNQCIGISEPTVERNRLVPNYLQSRLMAAALIS